MVQLKNTTAQTLQPGQSITFDDLVSWSGNGECARSGGPVGLRFPGAIYKIFNRSNARSGSNHPWRSSTS